MTRIGAELVALRATDGRIYPSIAIDWARQNPDSALYRAFVWDDAVAGERYRLIQARQLIAIHVVDDVGHRQTISLMIDRSVGGGYRDMGATMSSEEMRRLAAREALTELIRWRDRHRHLDRELAGLFRSIDAFALLEPPDQEAA
jgi:hypothetical protein